MSVTLTIMGLCHSETNPLHSPTPDGGDNLTGLVSPLNSSSPYKSP